MTGAADRRPAALPDQIRVRFGVEAVCRVLSEHGVRIAPRTYYAAKTPLRRRGAGRVVLAEIDRVHADPQPGRGLHRSGRRR